MNATPRQASPPCKPIPDRLNVSLVMLVFAGAVALLWLGSYVRSWWAVLAVGVAFSDLLLTNDALLHEATHGNLHSSPRLNYLLGLVGPEHKSQPASSTRGAAR